MGFALSEGDWLNPALPVLPSLAGGTSLSLLNQCRALSALLSRDEEPQMPRKILGWDNGTL